MASIATYLQRIKNAIYGEEVRDSIHDSIEAINDEVEAWTGLQDGTVTTSKLASNAVTTAKVADGSITRAKLNADVVDTTLAVSGAPADAKKVGDEVSNLKTAVNQINHYQQGIVVTSNDITITKTGSSPQSLIVSTPQNLWLFVSNGLSAFTRCTPTATSWTVANNEILVLNKTTNDVEVISQGTFVTNIAIYILLIWNHYGTPQGQWAHYYTDAQTASAINELDVLTKYAIIPYEETVVVAFANVDITVNSNTITVNTNGSPLFAFEKANLSEAFKRITPTQNSHSLNNGELLVVNKTINDVQVVSQVTYLANRANYTLLVWNHYGTPQGQWYHYYKEKQLNDKIELNTVPIFAITNNYMSRQGQFGNITGENTIAGIKYAKSHGFNNIRLSACFTSDGYGVLSHFDQLNQLTGVTKTGGGTIADSELISSMTLATLNANYTYYGSAFVSLDDAIQLCKQINLELTIELKTAVDASVAQNYTKIIRALGMQKFVCWSSADTIALSNLASADENINVAYIAHLNTSARVDTVISIIANGYKRIDAYNSDTYDETIWSYAREKGISIKIGSVYNVEQALAWSPYCDVLECANIENPARAVYDALDV